MGKDGWSRGDNQSSLMDGKKGYPHPSVFKKVYKVFYNNVEIVHAISTRENSISKCLFQQRYRDVVFSMSCTIVCEN